MGIYINRGNGSFRSARQSDYVDKSALISFINGTINTENRFTCVSRARRFGKSMAARMLYAYYDKSSDSRKLFEDLRVADPANAANQNPDTAFETHLNKYPTLYIDIMDFDGVKQTIENLLIGNEEQVPVLNYGNDRNALESRDELFALLTHYGYFAYNLNHQTLHIPNQEVRAELLQVVKTGNRPELVQLIKQSDQLLEATLSMDEAYVAQALDTLHSQYTSPRFYNNEQSLRALVRYAYIGATGSFVPMEELPSGKGFGDVAFIPAHPNGKPVILVELKYDETADTAIRQVKEQRYPEKLAQFTGNLLLVGINYDKKTKKHTCRIEHYEP